MISIILVRSKLLVRRLPEISESSTMTMKIRNQELVVAAEERKR
tara:strand:- start:345 stop:476 length:132 start_codon:yes stop_codon:yes gene_type:complete